MRIESTTNPRVKAVKRLHRARERRATGRTLLEGPKLLEAALDKGVVPSEVFAGRSSQIVERAERAGAQICEVTDTVTSALSTTVEAQDPVSVVAIPAFEDLSRERTVVLVDISDPGNMGTLIRTAAALGWRVALLGGADPWSPKVLRAGAGAHFARSISVIDSISQVEAAGLTTVATAISGGAAPEDVTAEAPLALLIGSEAHGLSAEAVQACEWQITIPMDGSIESLNASIAGAIAMYALSHAG